MSEGELNIDDAIEFARKERIETSVGYASQARAWAFMQWTESGDWIEVGSIVEDGKTYKIVEQDNAPPGLKQELMIPYARLLVRPDDGSIDVIEEAMTDIHIANYQDELTIGR